MVKIYEFDHLAFCYWKNMTCMCSLMMCPFFKVCMTTLKKHSSCEMFVLFEVEAKEQLDTFQKQGKNPSNAKNRIK